MLPLLFCFRARYVDGTHMRDIKYTYVFDERCGVGVNALVLDGGHVVSSEFNHLGS